MAKGKRVLPRYLYSMFVRYAYVRETRGNCAFAL